ncbi:hypothetical protein [Lysinibacillus fusiformis]|uniref:hypothetical protein n=1 Tax=Lysinibacillus fusiformis TaxID=28031 RepID=UPI0036E0242F
MLTGQIKVTKEDLLQWIENYRWMVEMIEEARQQVAKMNNNSYKKLHKRFLMKRKLFQTCYSGVFVLILVMTIYRIASFRNEINPYFEYEISYLNPFSNHLFLTSGHL